MQARNLTSGIFNHWPPISIIACRWVKPEAAANRVWLRRGTLQLIPLPSKACSSVPASPSRAQALQILKSAVDTQAPSQMQVLLALKLLCFPHVVQVSYLISGTKWRIPLQKPPSEALQGLEVLLTELHSVCI